MVSKKANSTVKVTAAKAEEKAAVKEAVEAKAVKAEEKAAKTPVAKPEKKADKKETEAAKAIETKKDSTMKLETKAADKAVEKTAAKKTAAKKSTAKKAELKTEMFLQFAGKEYTEKEILQKVKEIWTKNLKRKVGEMKDVKIYLKPEESAAYYVVNGDTTGRVDL